MTETLTSKSYEVGDEALYEGPEASLRVRILGGPYKQAGPGLLYYSCEMLESRLPFFFEAHHQYFFDYDLRLIPQYISRYDRDPLV